MNKNYPIDDLHNLLASAASVLVAVPQSPTFDQVAASLALYLALNKAGKQTSIVSPEQMRVEHSHLVGVDQITNKVPSGELVLTIDVPIENIEKVTSTDESGKLNLTIKPKAGVPAVKQENIIFASSGGTSDLVLVMEARRKENLGQIFQDNQNLFQEKPVVNISRFEKVEQFGRLNLVDPQASSCSEIVASLIEALNLPVDTDIASNLLLGLKDATQNFTIPATTAETFEAAAFCLRNGAGQNQIQTQVPQETQQTEEQPEQPQTQPSPDWYEPKIYKGSTLA